MTAIVAALTNEEVVVGADSKVTWSQNPGSPTACKIIQLGHIFITYSGFEGDGFTGFTVDKLLGLLISQERALIR